MRRKSLAFAIDRIATLLLGAVSIITFGSATADAQEAQTAEPQQESSGAAEIGEVVVTGFRQSLENSTEAKRASVTFTDAIFAEDIGKFPDTNIAESFNRIPGITITREITGEGLNIAIRGLGTNFTHRSPQRRAGRHRFDRPHRRPEYQPRSGSRPVPDRALHPAHGEQDLDGRA